MDFYKEHIASVSEDHGVVATENICNQHGQTIVASGAQIDSTSSERILKFKLLKPIESSIAIESELSVDDLYQHITDYMCDDNSLFEVYLESNLGTLLRDCCEFAFSYDIIRQKLTVLHYQYPNQFDQTLFVSWFTVLIEKKSGKQDTEIYQSFTASICRDLGLLHIDPKILISNEKLTPEQWRQLQSHPIISQKIVEALEGLSDDCARGVLEHHENLDGTGFPSSKLASQLAPLGQILALLDGTYANYAKFFKPLGRTLADVVPIIQMNSRAHFGNFSDIFVASIRCCSRTDHTVINENNIADAVAEVIACHKYISDYLACAFKLISEFAKSSKGPRLVSMQKGYLHIHQSVTQSGLINLAYIRWVEQVREEKLKNAYREVEDSLMMMREVIYQIDRLNIQLSTYVTKEGEKGATANSPSLFQQLITFEKPVFKTLT
ncbi:HD-GYP domain-containing protein [Saccharophagus degradans]|uniref:HD domain-containing phosphohydrolase n=2 Tax=Gammaproteobacteria TaxID=1236 RepID=A0AAW7X3I5_9GAMM|nr:HD domain-containing phosphohydrolase [Saccharophagus degradans]MDO6421974.1 HD domain-containing phosphohydrolase [Saccharophagus degradans]MDO6606333.1 HD domain-containing phosphohydrolase [Saccharophagus degradans]